VTERIRALAAVLKRHPRLALALQLAAFGVLVGFLAFAMRGAWHDALPRLRSTDPVELALALVVLAAYYGLFVVGWQWILASWQIRLPYRVALQAEMVSMLAKYVPGGVWTPAARVVALRRRGYRDTPLVLASILLEAGISAVAGVVVFVASIPLVHGVNAPLLPLLAFAALIVAAVHPRVFRPLAARLLKPFGTTEVPPLRYPTLLALLVYYSFTWLVGGAALFFLLRSVGAHPGVDAIPFLGGTSAVGAIVSVLAVFAPSGLGVREASTYGLMLAVASEGAALGATVLNRIAITLVEAALLAGAALMWRFRAPRPA
jgi:glycosyltransferase 2 family protein